MECGIIFMANLMNREDAAEVVHLYCQKYTKKEVKKYSKCYSHGQRSKSEQEKEGRFQLTEGLEWFFSYKEGKEVPDDQVLGYELMENWQQAWNKQGSRIGDNKNDSSLSYI